MNASLSAQLDEFVSAFEAARDLGDRWEETFPTEKPKGQTFFWRGKILALRGQPRDAARFLARSVGLAPGAPFEAEARWLLAQSLEQLGKNGALSSDRRAWKQMRLAIERLQSALATYRGQA